MTFVAFDANYIRAGLEPHVLQALRARGLRLAFGCFAFMEVWASAYRQRKMGLLMAPICRFAPFLDAEHPIIPAGSPLTAQLRAPARERRELRRAFPRNTAELFRCIANGERVLAEPAKEIALAAQAELDKLSRMHRDAMDHARQLGLDPAAVDMSVPMLVQILTRGLALAFNLSAHADRLDAYLRVLALEAVHAMRCTPNQRAPQENDAEDVIALQYVGFPAILVTRDAELTRRVDESLTCQAPWLRTVGELLTDELPLGDPWGRSAVRQARSFARRPRKERAKLETRVCAALVSKAELPKQDEP